MAESRTARKWKNLAIAMVGGLAISAAPLLFFGRSHAASPDPTRIMVVTIDSAVAMAWILVFTVRMFRSLDEYAQHRARVGWYWGAAIGLAASAPAYAFIGLGGLHWLWPDRFHLGKDLFQAFVMGYMLPVLFQAGGAMVASLWWRWAKR